MLGREVLYICRGTPEICVGAPPLLFTYEWITAHALKGLLFFNTCFLSCSAPHWDIHLRSLRIQYITKTCWLVKKVPVSKGQSSAVAVRFAPSRGPPEIPACCLSFFTKNLQPYFQGEENFGTLLCSLNYMVTAITNHGRLPVYLARPFALRTSTYR